MGWFSGNDGNIVMYIYGYSAILIDGQIHLYFLSFFLFSFLLSFLGSLPKSDAQAQIASVIKLEPLQPVFKSKF